MQVTIAIYFTFTVLEFIHRNETNNEELKRAKLLQVTDAPQSESSNKVKLNAERSPERR
jgi:hypothetical protein